MDIGPASYTYRETLLVRPLASNDPNRLDLGVQSAQGQAKEVPSATLVVPIHFAGVHALANVKQALALSEEAMDVCIVLDNCSTLTDEPLISALTREPVGRKLRQLLVYTTQSDIFETAADNVGFMSSRTEYVIELQSDMRILEQGWDARLLAPLRQVPWLFAIGGRACHSWSWLGPVSRATTGMELRQKLRGRLTGNYATKILDVESFTCSDAFGALDQAGIESVTQLQHLNRNEVFLSDSVNRGPLAIRSSTLRALGFLDEAAYVLGGDEHDLMLRAHLGAGLRCGYVPLLVESPRAHSATSQTPAPSTVTRRQTLESVKTRLRTTSALGRYLQVTRGGRRQMAPPREVLYLDDVARGRN